jgi:ribosomal protein S10
MDKITSLADEIRSRIAQQPEAPVKKETKKRAKTPDTEILQHIRDYENADHKTLVHVRFDEQTVRTLHQFKMATGVDLSRLVAFSVRQLFEQHPELKETIKQFMQNL